MSHGGCASGAVRREAGSGSPSSRFSPLYLWSSCAHSHPPSATARRRPAGIAPVRVMNCSFSRLCVCHACFAWKCVRGADQSFEVLLKKNLTIVHSRAGGFGFGVVELLPRSPVVRGYRSFLVCSMCICPCRAGVLCVRAKAFTASDHVGRAETKSNTHRVSF